MQGLVIRNTGSAYTVLLEDGEQRECHIKGNFRIRGIRTTNPVAVGDRVNVEDDWICEVMPRRNYIIRRSTNLSKEAHIIAANIDQVALLVTLAHPVTSLTFIDRFLATAEAYRVPAVLIFNKVDLLTSDQQTQLCSLRELYERLGYPTFAISAIQPSPLSLDLFASKTTLLSGNSGVGKSTLLNALFGRQLTRTGLISAAHDKGMHTTTFSEMYPLPFPNYNFPALHSQCSWIIDTPGIKGFGSVRMQPTEVSHYFREIFDIGQGCRYDDCLHTNSCSRCAVIEAVEQGKIALSRYESYLSLLGDASESKYR